MKYLARFIGGLLGFLLGGPLGCLLGIVVGYHFEKQNFTDSKEPTGKIKNKK